jgi:DNA primase
MRHMLSRYDLDRVDARLAAVREAAGLRRSIRDRSLVDGSVRDLAALAGMEVEEVRRAVASAPRRPSAGGRAGPGPGGPPDFVAAGSARPPGQTVRDGSARGAGPADLDEPPDDGPPDEADDWARDQAGADATPLPDPGDRSLQVERDTLKLILQRPDLFASAPEAWYAVTADDFAHPAYRAVFATVVAAADAAGPDWARRVLLKLPEAHLRDWAVQLAVEPLVSEPTPRHVQEYCAKLRLLAVARTLAQLKSAMQRTNPVTDQARYDEMFRHMIDLEVRRQSLLQITLGEM